MTKNNLTTTSTMTTTKKKMMKKTKMKMKTMIITTKWMKTIWPTSYNNRMTYLMKAKTSTQLFSKKQMKPKNFKKKYRPKTKTMTTNQEMTKTFRWKQMTAMVKKKMIKESVEPEKSEYGQLVGNTSKQERTTPNTTVQSQRRLSR
jgi:hypothetical protein